jgi:hypothetical protein
MSQVIASSWSQLTDLLFEGAWDEPLKRFRSPFAFRGLSDADYSLQTSLTRLGGAYEKVEGHLIRNFIKYARRNVESADSIWHWLAIAQHHGLPTRLLDWTFSPYVALHFATANVDRFNADGVIWCVNYVVTNQLIPDVLRKLLAEEEGFLVFTAEMLAQASPSLRHFDSLSPHPFVIFMEPPSLDDRIANQAALFSIMSSPTAALDRWLIEHPEAFRRIIIPTGLKWEVRDKLDQINITERVLFPGLDGLSQTLRRYYSPRTR